MFLERKFWFMRKYAKVLNLSSCLIDITTSSAFRKFRRWLCSFRFLNPIADHSVFAILMFWVFQTLKIIFLICQFSCVFFVWITFLLLLCQEAWALINVLKTCSFDILIQIFQDEFFFARRLILPLQQQPFSDFTTWARLDTKAQLVEVIILISGEKCYALCFSFHLIPLCRFPQQFSFFSVHPRQIFGILST